MSNVKHGLLLATLTSIFDQLGQERDTSHRADLLLDITEAFREAHKDAVGKFVYDAATSGYGMTDIADMLGITVIRGRDIYLDYCHRHALQPRKQVRRKPQPMDDAIDLTSALDPAKRRRPREWE